MTSEEYFATPIPTSKYFKAWTKLFFERADKAIEAAEKYLSETTKKGRHEHRRKT